jgi:excisionase family DNA binding protein
MITTQSAAEILEVSDRRVRQLIKEGVLKTRGRFGRTHTLSRNSVLRLKAQRDEETAKRGTKQLNEVRKCRFEYVQMIDGEWFF